MEANTSAYSPKDETSPDSLTPSTLKKGGWAGFFKERWKVVMNALVCLVVAVAFLQSSVASETLVLPSGFENMQDDGFSGVLSSQIRIQTVYDAGQFEPGKWLLSEMRFRRDVESDLFAGEEIQVKVSLSTTSKSSNMLDRGFINNVGSDETVVFEGAVIIQSTNIVEGDGLPPFEFNIPFDEEFLFDPSEGNLLVEIVNYSGSSAPVIDSSNEPQDGASRIFSFNTDSSLASFSDTGADIVQFVVDEALPAPGVVEMVVPVGFENIEDDGYAGGFGSALRLQEVYGSGIFPDRIHAITHLAFRRDKSEEPYGGQVGNLTISLSATQRNPGTLFRTYSENIGINETKVFDGVIDLNSTTPSVMDPTVPNPFEMIVPLDVPFYYNPLDGNLLIDLVNENGSQHGFVDASNNTNDDASRVFGYSPTAVVAQYADTGADIVNLHVSGGSTVSVLAASDPVFNETLGMIEQVVEVRNASLRQLPAVRVYVPDLPIDVTITNPSGFVRGVPYIQSDRLMGVGGSARFTVYYRQSGGGSMPSPDYSPAVPQGASLLDGPATEFRVLEAFVNEWNDVGIQFSSIPEVSYIIEERDGPDGMWEVAVGTPIIAAGTRVAWIDPDSRNGNRQVDVRFYRVRRLQTER